MRFSTDDERVDAEVRCEMFGRETFGETAHDSEGWTAVQDVPACEGDEDEAGKRSGSGCEGGKGGRTRG